MNRTEALALCRYAKAACPQQAFDEYTPDAWADLLGDLTYDDCKAAIKAVVQSQPFVAPSEIRTHVRQIRLKRLTEFDRLVHPYPPPGLTDAQEITWRLELRESVATGHTTAEHWTTTAITRSDGEILAEIQRRATT